MVILLVVIGLAAWAFARLWGQARAVDRVVDLRRPGMPVLDLRIESLFDSDDVADLEFRFEEVERDLRDH